MNWALRFVGVGNAQAVTLGSASAVLERAGEPVLMIDCGPQALTAYVERYGAPPRAMFITHAHLDHIGGMERLFYQVYFDAARRGQTRLYVPARVVPLLQERLANYPDVLAEGGANFWDAFQLIPVSRGFWHEHCYFDVFEVRHHVPGSAHGLGLRGAFVYSGDTRPIPDVLRAYGRGDELIAHDCALHGNPSHTGLADLQREYSPSLRARMIVYHYGSAAEADALRAAGLRVAEPGAAVALADPEPLGPQL
jgi:ribonuclease BN (tRNA processing enzyme)